MKPVQPREPRFYKSLPAEKIGFRIGKNVRFVVENELCHGCGACFATCPTEAISMRMDDRLGIHLPQISDSDCVSCSLCVDVCSGFELDLGLLRRDPNEATEHPLVGPYNNIHRAYTTNTQRRERAASGGMVSEIASFLLDSGKVDFAIVTGMSPEEPLTASSFLAGQSSELDDSQKSKYCPNTLNASLRPIVQGQKQGRFVFVGLPHHVHGLRLMQRIFPELKEAVPWVISLFCSHVSSKNATAFTMACHDIAEDEVALIEYRGGGNPGRMRVQTKDGKEHLIPHLHWTYYGHAFPHFYYPSREWLYFDKLSEWADFSCGDNWQGGLSEQKGVSTVVTRSVRAEQVLQQMKLQDRIVARDMTCVELEADQVLKSKLNIKSRLWAWNLLGRVIPIYTREFDDSNRRPIGSLRFAANVLLSQRNPPHFLMRGLIWIDYQFRSRLKKQFRALGKFIHNGLMTVIPYRKLPAPPDDRIRVVIIGGYGYDDIGDEAMAHAVRQNLKKAFKERVEIVMLSPDPESTTRRHHERSALDFTRVSYHTDSSHLRRIAAICATLLILLAAWLETRGICLRLWRGAREAMDEYNKADLILNVGGGNITTNIPIEFYKKCSSYLVASIMGKPVYVSGQTMGPFEGQFNRWYARFCLETVRAISFRDQSTSGKRLASLGVSKPTMFDAADDAITLEGISTEEGLELLDRETKLKLSKRDGKLLILVNLKASLIFFKSHKRRSSLDSEITLLAAICDRLKEQYNCVLVFFSTDFSEGVDDRLHHQQVAGRMKHSNDVFVLQKVYEDVQLIGMIRNADITLGGRYHFHVFAAACYVPFIGFTSGPYQQTKLEGLANLCDVPECFIDHDMESATLNEVWPMIERVIDKRKLIEQKLRRTVPPLRQKSLLMIERISADFQLGA